MIVNTNKYIHYINPKEVVCTLLEHAEKRLVTIVFKNKEVTYHFENETKAQDFIRELDALNQ